MEGYIGEIRRFAGDFPPMGWAFCDGSALQCCSGSEYYSVGGGNMPDLNSAFNADEPVYIVCISGTYPCRS